MPKTISPIDHQRGRTPLRRDAQQWLLDYLIQETGKVFHFQGTTPDLRAQRREASPTMPTSVGLVLIVHLRHCCRCGSRPHRAPLLGEGASPSDRWKA